jgi:nicotinamide mononucleotide adenylyltransferase
MNKTIVVAFGRFQPLTIGHDNIISEVLLLAKINKCDHMIWVSTSHDDETNPLPIMEKVKSILSRKISIILHNNIFKFMQSLEDEYDNIIVVAGSDRINLYKKIFTQYHPKINFSFVEVNRNFINISGTEMRDYAKNNDKSNFMKYISSYVSPELKEEVYNRMRNELSKINKNKK